MSYAAFISYSHEADGHRARWLRDALHSFAKPWNKVRALRVFLDNAALSANPGLWSTVEQALGDSEFFLLLASPQSARSPWVAKEISWWRQGPRAANLLLVVTGGELHWDHSAQDFDWERSTCLPDALRGYFTEEPRWVDLRWLSEDHEDAPRDPRFRECVADLAAPLHSRPKDELIGEDVSQRRKLQRFRQAMLAVTTTLAVLASATAVYAFVQRNTARDQARLATARQLAATAVNLSGDDLDLASLLALQAYQVEETPETLSALYQLTTRSPHLVRFVRGDAAVTALALTTSRHYAAVGTAKGSVTVWTSDGSRRLGRISVHGEVTSLAFSDDDRLLAVGSSSGETVVRDVQGHSTRRLPAGAPGITGLAFQSSSHNLAVFDDEGALRLFGERSDAPYARVDTGLSGKAADLAFQDKGKKVTLVTFGGWRLYDGALRRLQSDDGTLYPANGYVTAASPSGNCFGFLKYGGLALMTVGQLAAGKFPGSEAGNCGIVLPVLPDEEAISLAVSDNHQVAIGTSKGLTVARRVDDTPSHAVVDSLPGVRAPSLLAFSPGAGDRLASASGTTVALWDLGKAGPTLHRHGARIPDGATVEYPPPLSVSGPGQVAWSQETIDRSPSTLHLWSAGKDLPSNEQEIPYDDVALSPDGGTLYAVSDTALTVWKKGPGALRKAAAVPLPANSDTLGWTRVACGQGGRAVILTTDGAVLIFDPRTGKLSTALPRTVPRLSDEDRKKTGLTEYTMALSEHGALAAIAPDKGPVRVYDVPSGRLLRRLDVGGGAVDALALSEKDRSLYANVDGHTLTRWDVGTGALRWRSDGSGGSGLAADPAGRWAATLSGDGTVWLWDARTGDRLADTALPAPDFSWSGTGGTGTQSRLAFSPDGKQLWSATEGGEVLTWDTSADAWIAALCGRVGRSLTPAERARYLTAVSRTHTACGAYPARTTDTP
ncbi:toll/interleukin-1 receptor domain-containing protein [Streptomyces sp. NRRL S-340]|uniref:toll/interleukin-1 receptor domain-containing protein n=1 Tax=Streptomyces sp. NRRL S-340 TaxID=1463901 RepID=UPI000566ECF6|nr:TIR domain-containing protein [Streptomyces sp. NRRL S-340]